MEAGQVDELLGHLHPGVEAALLGHVADGASDGGVHRGTHPGHGAGVGGEHPHDDAHRGGLARPVRTDETDDLAAVQGQGEIIQGLKAPEAFGQAGQFEHRGSFGFGDGATRLVEQVHSPILDRLSMESLLVYRGHVKSLCRACPRLNRPRC